MQAVNSRDDFLGLIYAQIVRLLLKTLNYSPTKSLFNMLFLSYADQATYPKYSRFFIEYVFC